MNVGDPVWVRAHGFLYAGEIHRMLSLSRLPLKNPVVVFHTCGGTKRKVRPMVRASILPRDPGDKRLQLSGEAMAEIYDELRASQPAEGE